MSSEERWIIGDTYSQWLHNLSLEIKNTDPIVKLETQKIVHRLVEARAKIEVRENFGLYSLLNDITDTASTGLLVTISDKTSAQNYVEDYQNRRIAKQYNKAQLDTDKRDLLKVTPKMEIPELFSIGNDLLEVTTLSEIKSNHLVLRTTLISPGSPSNHIKENKKI